MTKIENTRRSLPGILLGAILVVALSVPSGAAAADQAQSWRIDPNHTEVNFAVKHFFTPVTGSFQEFEIDLYYDAENPGNSRVEARIDVASVDTGNAKRDDHLRSADWFEAEEFPHMTFKSTSVRKAGKNKLIAKGVLTIKGQPHEIELPITMLGSQPIPENMQKMMGGAKEVASWTAATAIDRGDFAVGVGGWAATMVVGSKVEIEILVEAHRTSGT